MTTTANNGHHQAATTDDVIARAIDVITQAELVLRPMLAMLSDQAAILREHRPTTTPEEATR